MTGGHWGLLCTRCLWDILPSVLTIQELHAARFSNALFKKKKKLGGAQGENKET